MEQNSIILIGVYQNTRDNDFTVFLHKLNITGWLGRSENEAKILYYTLEKSFILQLKSVHFKCLLLHIAQQSTMKVFAALPQFGFIFWFLCLTVV